MNIGNIQKILISVVLLIMLFILPSRSAVADEPDYSLYDEILAENVVHGLVDYTNLKKEEGTLDIVLKSLEIIDPDFLTHEQRFAFYINAYNAWTLKLVLEEYPGIDSIKDIKRGYGSPWKIPLARIKGNLLTLDHIEHRILRPQFRDPRLHFAINCASFGCPSLRQEAYRGRILDKQLSEAAVKFINDPEKNYVRGDTLYLSRIFYWFRKDFGKDPLSFVRLHARNELAGYLSAQGREISIKYLQYDWALNDISGQ